LETEKEQKYQKFCISTNEFKKGYQPKINLVKNENGDLVADFPKYLGISGVITSVSY
jgi:hypothetical protein